MVYLIVDVPKKVTKSIHNQKVMITIMFTKHNFLLVNLLLQGQSFNSDYLISDTMVPTLHSFRKATGREMFKLNLDNCRVHNSIKSN